MDKIWLPSTTELNIMSAEDNYTIPSDETSSTVFKFFNGKSGEELQNALKAVRTPFVANNSKAMNYSIPLYQYQSTAVNIDINEKSNSLDYYWTRSAMSDNYANMRSVNYSGTFGSNYTDYSAFGVRPCMILKY